MKRVSVERLLKFYVLVSIVAIAVLIVGLLRTDSALTKINRSISTTNSNINGMQSTLSNIQSDTDQMCSKVISYNSANQDC